MKTNLFASVICLVFYTSHALSVNFYDSNLPIVVLSTGGQNIDSVYWGTKIIWMGIIDNGTGNRNHLNDAYVYTGLVEIEMHGSSTMKFPKKSWNIVTINSSHDKADVPLFGFPADHDWVFKALYQDKTFLRDELSFKIFNDIGHYSSRTKFFELVVDGDYRGVYQFEEKIKRNKNRVDVSKLQSNEVSGDDLTGGYIVKLDHVEPKDQGWFSQYPSNSTYDSANFFIYKYPKADSIPQAQKDYIKHYFDKFEDVLNSSYWNNADSGYRKYINVQSFIDIFLVEEFSRNVDGYRLSSFFYKDKDSKGEDGKLHAGPVWDYNIAWGNCAYSGGNNEYWWQYPMSFKINYVPFWWKKLITDNSFQDELQCRYQSLRASTLDKNYLYAHIDSLANFLNESQQRNFQKWQIMGTAIYPQPSPTPPDYWGEVGYLKYWIDQRLNWMDSHIPGMCIPNAIEANASENEMIKIYPNPFTNNFSVSYAIPPIDKTGRAEVAIEVFNSLGERIILHYGDKTTGVYKDEIISSQLIPGVYTVKLTVNNISFSQKLVKME